MENIGSIIKMNRIKQSLKQASLAKGICSPSYLCKIEGNSAKASEDVIQLLVERLNLDLNEIKLTRECSVTGERAVKELRETYRAAIQKMDIDFVQKKLNELKVKETMFQKNKLHFFTQVILRLLLMQNNLEESKYYIKFLESEENQLSKHDLYLLHKNTGIYYYKEKNIEKATKHFSKALEFSEDVTLEDWERADFYYILGIIHFTDNKISQALEYTNMALEYFKNNFIYNKATECYILLGICYTNLKKQKEALNIFFLVLKITDDLNIKSKKGIIYHNIGCIYSDTDTEKAITYFKKSLHYKKSPSEIIVTIFSIVDDYSKMKEWENVKTWVCKGLELLKQESISYEYTHHFRIYESLSNKGTVSETTILPAIEYFESISNYKYCYKYCVLLGSYLFDAGKYKNSAMMYQKANGYNQKIK